MGRHDLRPWEADRKRQSSNAACGSRMGGQRTPLAGNTEVQRVIPHGVTTAERLGEHQAAQRGGGRSGGSRGFSPPFVGSLVFVTIDTRSLEMGQQTAILDFLRGFPPRGDVPRPRRSLALEGRRGTPRRCGGTRRSRMRIRRDAPRRVRVPSRFRSVTARFGRDGA